MTRLLLLVEQQPTVMTSCGHCDTRTWEVGDKVVGLGEVLAGLNGRGLSS